MKDACTGQDSIAALLVGYGTDSQGQDYWLLKHSGGAKWGEEGYVRNSFKQRFAKIITEKAPTSAVTFKTLC